MRWHFSEGIITRAARSPRPEWPKSCERTFLPKGARVPRASLVNRRREALIVDVRVQPENYRSRSRGGTRGRRGYYNEGTDESKNDHNREMLLSSRFARFKKRARNKCSNNKLFVGVQLLKKTPFHMRATLWWREKLKRSWRKQRFKRTVSVTEDKFKRLSAMHESEKKLGHSTVRQHCFKTKRADHLAVLFAIKRKNNKNATNQS